ncbi:ATP-binding protein [Actinomadura sp. 1N219]|uniref:sensor histidine kinase n=1 Tax=Actinomadura sp. 1N219 TaxID=3375152 RepID=UPI0037970140
MSPTRSLAGQLLAWQMVIVFVLLGCVAGFSAVQAGRGFVDAEGRRLLSVAENVAATPGVRTSLADPVRRDPLATFAESARTLSGADAVLITGPDRRVLASPDPGQLHTTLPLGESTVTRGRAWVGVVDGRLVAHVPVVGAPGGGRGPHVVGIVAAVEAMPGLAERLTHAPGRALPLLGIATLLGIAGSVLLTWWVKRQTLGLEPREITGLVEHREALLHGIKEGVVAMDPRHRVTLLNDQARELLALPAGCLGSAVDDLEVNERLRDVLTGRAGGADQIVLRAGRVLVLNRMPVSHGGQRLGAVVTLRDSTELTALREELDTAARATDTLRAQAHEFTNRLHTIAGLVELGEYDEVRNYVDLVARTHRDWQEQVTARIGDPAVAALLIAKASLAAERGVGMRLAETSALQTVDERLSADLVTVVGNLVENALDALAGSAGDWIEVAVHQDAGAVSVVVRDSGPGVAPEIATEVFAHGFTTKAAGYGRRGLGLALTRQACVRRGGSVRVRNAVGAEFTAVLPVGTEAAR